MNRFKNLGIASLFVIVMLLAACSPSGELPLGITAATLTPSGQTGGAQAPAGSTVNVDQQQQIQQAATATALSDFDKAVQAQATANAQTRQAAVPTLAPATPTATATGFTLEQVQTAAAALNPASTATLIPQAATVTLVPTALPTQSVQLAQVQPTASTAMNCPAPADLKKLPANEAVVTNLGLNPNNIKIVFTGTDWDPAKWNWQSNTVAPQSALTLHVPPCYQVTASFLDSTVVAYEGPVVLKNVLGFTVRDLHYAADIEQNPAWLLGYENRFSLVTTPGTKYLTLNGNLTGVEACPTTADQVAFLVGGNAAYWTQPTWVGGGWVMYTTGAVNLHVPANSAAWVDNGNDKFWQGQSVSTQSATYHCHNVMSNNANVVAPAA